MIELHPGTRVFEQYEYNWPLNSQGMMPDLVVAYCFRSFWIWIGLGLYENRSLRQSQLIMWYILFRTSFFLGYKSVWQYWCTIQKYKIFNRVKPHHTFLTFINNKHQPWVEITPPNNTSDQVTEPHQNQTMSIWSCWLNCTHSWLVCNYWKLVQEA